MFALTHREKVIMLFVVGAFVTGAFVSKVRHRPHEVYPGAEVVPPVSPDAKN